MIYLDLTLAEGPMGEGVPVLLDRAQLGELLPGLIVQRSRCQDPDIPGPEPDRRRTSANWGHA